MNILCRYLCKSVLGLSLFATSTLYCLAWAQAPQGSPSQLFPDVTGGVRVKPPSKIDAPGSLLGTPSSRGEPGPLGASQTANPEFEISDKNGLGFDPKTYIVGPGDTFQVSLLGAVVDQIAVQVNPEGTLVIPRLGEFKASGRFFAVLREEVLDKLRASFKNLTYSFTLLKPRTFKIFVLGEVNNPMAVPASALTPLSEVIQTAGGLRPSASRQKVSVRRNGQSSSFDLQRFYRDGDISQNPTLLEGDVVFVPLRGQAVYIGGGVEYPGTYELREGLETLWDLIEAAKPMKSKISADTLLKLQRKNEEGREVVTQIRLSDVPTRAKAITLESSDIVQYPFGNIGLAPTEADRVYVSGEVRTPGAFAYSSHLTVQDYIGQSGGLSNRANFSRAQIVKKNGVSYRLNDQVRLEPGDTLYVPEVTFKFWQDHIAIIGTLLGIFATTVSITALTR